MSKINLLYYGCPFDLSGYGTVARNHLTSLSKIKNLCVRLRTKKFWTGVSPDLKKKGDFLHSLERNPLLTDNFIFLQHLTPENFYIDPRAKYHICYTPFETDGVPLSWLLSLRAMDEIWVPSQHNKEAYLRAGLKNKRIEVIPHGVDLEFYNQGVKPLEYNRSKFNFGSIFDWTERKNPNALIKAYYMAFNKKDDVSLTLRTFWRFPIEKTKEYVYGEIQKIKNSFVGRTDFPKILCWFDVMVEDLMPSFYRSFDCFVSPTRGEGFGLPFLEAMAVGTPVIGPEWGGNREFMNENNSILVKGEVIPISDKNFLSLQPQYSGQKWFEININELSDSMRFAYENEDKAQELSQNALDMIKGNLTWDNTAGKIYKRLLEIENS
jgi:glycosyltransferase involved in cell wall biosynthesis